jgi:hypothetical protein
MPFYCGKRSAGICVALGPKISSTYSLGKERVLASACSAERRAWGGGCNRPRLRSFRASGLACASISFPSQRRMTRTDS